MSAERFIRRSCANLLARMALIAIGDRVLVAAAQLEPAGIRSLAAIHLATALRIDDDLAAFVTYDKRQLEAAEAVGLSVTSPR